ncbi:MAG TPA: hypothetical protein VI197_30185 [Polyangiaceae bacterium]
MSRFRFEDVETPGAMTAERYAALDRGEGCLVFEEFADGWHFCLDRNIDRCEGVCRWCGFDPRAFRPVGSDS